MIEIIFDFIHASKWQGWFPTLFFSFFVVMMRLAMVAVGCLSPCAEKSRGRERKAGVIANNLVILSVEFFDRVHFVLYYSLMPMQRHHVCHSHAKTYSYLYDVVQSYVYLPHLLVFKACSIYVQGGKKWMYDVMHFSTFTLNLTR